MRLHRGQLLGIKVRPGYDFPNQVVSQIKVVEARVNKNSVKKLSPKKSPKRSLQVVGEKMGLCLYIGTNNINLDVLTVENTKHINQNMLWAKQSMSLCLGPFTH